MEEMRPLTLSQVQASAPPAYFWLEEKDREYPYTVTLMRAGPDLIDFVTSKGNKLHAMGKRVLEYGITWRLWETFPFPTEKDATDWNKAPMVPLTKEEAGGLMYADRYWLEWKDSKPVVIELVSYLFRTKNTWLLEMYKVGTPQIFAFILPAYNYGKAWRLWPAEPTEADKEYTPWIS